MGNPKERESRVIKEMGTNFGRIWQSVYPLQWRDEQVVSRYQPFESEIWGLAAPFID